MAEQNQQASDAKIKQEFNKLSIVFKDQLKTSKESKETLQKQSVSLEGLQKEVSGFTNNIKAVKTTMIKNLEVSKLGNKKLLESNKKLIKNIEKIKNPSSGKNDKTSMFFEKQEEENRAKLSYQETHITLLEDILKALSFKKKKKEKEEDEWWDDLLDLGWIGGIGVALLGIGSFFLGLLSGLKQLIFKNFPSVEKAWKKVKKSFGTFGEKFSKLGDTIKNWGNKIKNNKFFKFFSGKGGALSRLTGLFSGFSGVLKFLRIMFRFGRLLGTANPYILAAIAVWDGLMGGFEELATLDKDATFGEKTMAFIKGAFKGVIAGFVGGLLDLGNMIMAWVVGFFSPELAASMKEMNFTELMKKRAGVMFDGIIDIFTGGFKGIVALFKGDFKTAGAEMRKMADGFVKFFSNGRLTGLKDLKDSYKKMKAGVKKWWKSFSFKKLLKKYITDPISKGMDKIGDWFDKTFTWSNVKKFMVKSVPIISWLANAGKQIKRWLNNKINFKTMLYNTFIKPIVDVFNGIGNILGRVKKWISEGVEGFKKGAEAFLKGGDGDVTRHGGGLLRGGTTKVLAGEAIERLKTGELYVHNESKTKGIMDKSEQMAARQLQPQAPPIMASNPTNNMINNSNSNNTTTNNTSIAKFGPDAALMDVFVGAAVNA